MLQRSIRTRQSVQCACSLGRRLFALANGALDGLRVALGRADLPALRHVLRCVCVMPPTSHFRDVRVLCDLPAQRTNESKHSTQQLSYIISPGQWPNVLDAPSSPRGQKSYAVHVQTP